MTALWEKDCLIGHYELSVHLGVIQESLNAVFNKIVRELIPHIDGIGIKTGIQQGCLPDQNRRYRL